MNRVGTMTVPGWAFVASLFAAFSVSAQEASSPSEGPPILVQQDWNRAVSVQLQEAGAEIVTRGGQSGISGQFTPKVRFSVPADGAVTDAKIATSSGNEAVDKLAVQFPPLAAPLPAFTPDMTPEAKGVVAPLRLNFEAPQTKDTTQQ